MIKTRLLTMLWSVVAAVIMAAATIAVFPQFDWGRGLSFNPLMIPVLLLEFAMWLLCLHPVALIMLLVGTVIIGSLRKEDAPRSLQAWRIRIALYGQALLAFISVGGFWASQVSDFLHTIHWRILWSGWIPLASLALGCWLAAELAVQAIRKPTFKQIAILLLSLLFIILSLGPRWLA